MNSRFIKLSSKPLKSGQNSGDYGQNSSVSGQISGKLGMNFSGLKSRKILRPASGFIIWWKLRFTIIL